MSWNNNSGWIHNIKTDNTCSSFERVKQSKYLGTTLTYQNYIQEEIKSRLKPRNTCYHSVQNLLSFSLLSKNIKINIQRTIILPVVVYECETWSLTLREKRRLKVFENRVLTTIFGPKRDKIKGEWRKLYNKELKDLYSPNVIWVIKTRRKTWDMVLFIHHDQPTKPKHSLIILKINILHIHSYIYNASGIDTLLCSVWSKWSHVL